MALIKNRLRTLSFREIIKLFRFFIFSPRYILPTYKATKLSLEICDVKFGKKHHHDNRENAFRHALWNFMLCKHYFEVSGSKEDAILRAKRITDLHEELMPNRKIARMMDLHNNKIGRKLFSEENCSNITDRLLEMMQNAKILNTISEIEQEDDGLIYLEN